MGALPSHPELLDWLADDVPRLGRLAQAAPPADRHQRRLPAGVAATTRRPRPIDADNHWLWRQNRRRLDAESIHDAILRARRPARHRRWAGRRSSSSRSARASTSRPSSTTPQYDWDSPGSCAAERLSLPLPHAARPVLRRPRCGRRLAAHRRAQRVDHAAPGPRAAEQPVRAPPVRAVRRAAASDAPRRSTTRSRLAFELAYGRPPAAGRARRCSRPTPRATGWPTSAG